MIYQFYVIEIKRDANGEYEHNIRWAWDADRDLAQRKAEAIAHGMLAEAAMSETISHSVTVLTDQGFTVMNKCYQNISPAAETQETEEEPQA